MNKHLNNFLDKSEGLPENTTNKNIQKEIDHQSGKTESIEQNTKDLKEKQPALHAEMMKQGFEASHHVDDKTGEPFIGWSKSKKKVIPTCQHCGLDPLSPEHKIEPRWSSRGFSGVYIDMCVKAPQEFNIACPSA